MKTPDDFELKEDYAVYRPSGQTTVDEGVRKAAAVMSYCRAQKIRRLLFDTTHLDFPAPTTMERFNMGASFASATGGAVRVVVVAKAEMIDPQKFGLTVARNRGLWAEVFTSEDAAVKWLLDPNPR